MSEPSGYVIYQGPSLLDGQPIVAIATTSSRNTKTGSMVSVWIMRQDVDPVTASRLGYDASVCGGCAHRGTARPDKASGQADGRGCYVILYQAPRTVWQSWQRGIYPMARTVSDLAAIGRGRMVRNAAYGDGAALPAWITIALGSEAAGHTAYSHQSRNPASSFDASRYMVSVESVADAQAAWAVGQRTFRIVDSAADLVAGREIECPSNRGVQCADCGLCGGGQVAAKSIAIAKHGNGAGHIVTA